MYQQTAAVFSFILSFPFFISIVEFWVIPIFQLKLAPTPTKERNPLLCPYIHTSIFNLTVPLEKRLEADREPRDPKQEGLFVPKFPPVGCRNMKKTQRRLVMEKSMFVKLNMLFILQEC